MRLLNTVPILFAAIFGILTSTSIFAQLGQKTEIDSNSPISMATKPFAFHLIKGRVVTSESLVRINQGETVEITVQSDLPGELHLHAYRLKLPIMDNSPQKLSFKANASGKFQFEWHPRKNTEDRSQSMPAHHGPPMASLEVIPQ
jgi:hypothetical protein